MDVDKEYNELKQKTKKKNPNKKTDQFFLLSSKI